MELDVKTKLADMVRSHLSKHAGTKGVQITEMFGLSETILFVYKVECFPFNAQQSVCQDHYFAKCLSRSLLWGFG